MDPHLRRKLIDEIAPQVADLGALIGRDLRCGTALESQGHAAAPGAIAGQRPSRRSIAGRLLSMGNRERPLRLAMATRGVSPGGFREFGLRAGRGAAAVLLEDALLRAAVLDQVVVHQRRARSAM